MTFRGRVGDDLTPAVAERIGRAYGTLMIQRYGVRQVVAGRDNRPSSEGLRDGPGWPGSVPPGCR